MSDVVLTGQVGNVLVVTLNRPEARNALDTALMEELSAVLRAAEADTEVRAIVLTGAGTVFCAGLDLKAFAAGASIKTLVWFFHRSVATPVVAALNGAALGGGFELMLACDLVVAAEGAKLGITEVRRGLFAAGGGTALSARVPMAQALELGLTGDPVTAERAREMGLVNRVVPADRVLAEAVGLAERIAENGPLGVAMTKKLMRERRWCTPAEVDEVFRSADAAEGARAFAERRPPVWTGR
ncbi:enoyl-CoA hydratase-related protein [Actinocorallia libanotica]|uniref:Crotonase/enoyl-CoA hydratase family protein n=1 Tax=Actinocorallia libanotica TaxID=46162 RepID=A0ABN1Q3D7_9ACTN